MKARGRFNYPKFRKMMDGAPDKTQFAASLGSGLTTCYHYAHGRREPGFSVVVQLAEATGTTPNDWVLKTK